MKTNKTDVIIIGAGIIGCATAFELSKKGYKTLNIDKLATCGAGSTVNSCAIVRLSYSTYDGIALALEGLRYWQDWENYLEVPDERGLAKFEQNGSLLIKSPERRMVNMLTLFDRLGIEYEEWDLATLRERMPIISTASHYPPTNMADERFWAESNSELVGAIYVHESGYITDPQLSTHNIMVAAQNYGAEFLFNSTVTEIRRDAERVTGVTLADGQQINAPIVINIAGPHSGVINRMAGVEGEMNIKTTPLRHEVHHVPAPKGVDLDSYISTCGDSDVGIYFRPEVGNNILLGSKDPECDPREWVDDPDVYNRNLTKEQWEVQVYRLAKRFPNLGIPSTPKGIVDLYDVSDDWLPIYDKSSLKGFYMAVGTSGNQFKNAAPAGYMMAKLIEAVENGHDHDNNPIQYQAPYTGETINVGFYSRLREINKNSSFSVSG